MITVKNNDFIGKMLLEASLQRLWHHFKNGQFGLVSAFTEGRTLKQNLEATMELMDDVRKMGYGYIPVKGYWENVEERSLFIPDINRDEVDRLAQKFKQYAYIWGNKGHWYCFKTGTDEVLAEGDEFKVFGVDTEVKNYSQIRARKFILADIENIINKLEAKENKDEHTKKTIEGYWRKLKSLRDKINTEEEKIVSEGRKPRRNPNIDPNIDLDAAVEWAKNIAYNYRHGIDTKVLGALMDACKELGIPFSEVDRRYQYADDSDFRDWRMVYFILTGDMDSYGRGFF